MGRTPLVVFIVAALVFALVITADGQSAQASHDSEAPTWPIGSEIVVESLTSRSASLTWTSAVDNVGVAGYRLYRDGGVFATTSGPSADLTNLDPGTDYQLRVEAFDAEGNESAPGGDFVLQSRVDVYAGRNPHSIKGEDVDDDGIPDLVSAVAGDDGVSIRLGNGDGTFGSPDVYRSGTAAGDDAVYPKNALVVYVNGDDRVDLVTANQNSDSIGILLGNGDGTFETATDLATCNGTHDVTVGDFVGDSAIDVAAVCWGANTMTLWTGNGDGTFKDRRDILTGEPASCFTPTPLAGTATATHASLLTDAVPNEFANVEIGSTVTKTVGGATAVVASKTVDTITTVLPIAGGWTIGDAYTITNLNPERCAHGIAAGDFNGAGNDDIAVAAYGGVSANVLLGNSGGTFETPVTHPVDGNPHDIAIGDFDDDGDPDLVTANESSNTVTVLLGGSGGRRGLPSRL
jgi:hypothetical protein